MNVQQRNSDFLSLTAKLLKPDHVKAVATKIGCPNWVDGCCDAIGHPRTPSECFCAEAAKEVLELENREALTAE